MYSWKQFKELKKRVLKNKTQMLKDHLTTSVDKLINKINQL